MSEAVPETYPHPDPSEIILFLKALQCSEDDIKAKIKSHPDSHTVEAWRSHCDTLFPTALMCKNMFLRSKKTGALFLVVALADTKVDMKKLTKDLGFSSGTLRFGPDDELYEKLGVRKGSVTPLGLFNPASSCVSVILDAKMMGQPKELLFHPLRCDMTLPFSVQEFKTFLAHGKTQYTTKDLE